MKSPSFLTWILVSAIGGSLAAEPAASGVGLLEIQSRTSWTTAAEPEVHLLLRNPSDEDVLFSLYLGMIPGVSEVRCAGQAADVNPDFPSRFHVWNGISFGLTRGVVPPKGWAHRSLIVGESGGMAPCDVPYRLEIEKGKDEIAEAVEGSILAEKQSPPQRGEVSENGIEWSSVVERDRLYGTRLITRLLVTNRENHRVVVLLDDRRLSCSKGDAPTWAVHHATVQGEDVGPYELAVGGWAVFVAAVNVPESANPKLCRASMQIVADTPAGLRPVRVIEFPLTPTGFSDAATKGRR